MSPFQSLKLYPDFLLGHLHASLYLQGVEALFSALANSVIYSISNTVSSLFVAVSPHSHEEGC